MNENYYIDVVTKNILSALSEHISNAVAGHIRQLMRESAALLEGGTPAKLEALGKTLQESIDENKRLAAVQSLEIGNLKKELTEIKLAIDASKTSQLDALVKSVDDKIKNLDDALQNSGAGVEKLIRQGNEFLARETGNLTLALKTSNEGTAVELSQMRAELNDVRLAIDASRSSQIDALVKSVDDKIKNLGDALQNFSAGVEKQIRQGGELAARETENLNVGLKSFMQRTTDELSQLLGNSKSASDDSMRNAVAAEIKKLETSVSAGNARMLGLLKSVVEIELKNADALSEKAELNKKALREKLSAVEKLSDGPKP
jgi:type VI protein secretion system component VasK